MAVGAERADLLGKILQSPLITSDQLVSAGAVRPTDAEARKARPALGTEDGELEISWDDAEG